MPFTGYSQQQITIAKPITPTTFTMNYGTTGEVTFILKNKFEIKTDLSIEDSAKVILFALTQLYDNEFRRMQRENKDLKNEIIKVKIHNFETILEDILRK